MNKSKYIKMALIILITILLLLKGIGMLLAFVVDSDSTKDKMGRIELPNKHYFIKIHTDNIALNNGTETVVEGKIENVIWNEDYLLFDIQNNTTPSKKIILYDFETQKMVNISDSNDYHLTDTHLSIDALKPISNYFFETQK